MTQQVQIVSGSEIEIPLDMLKKSPRNARKTPHAQAAIEALAASIAAKKMLQKPVVEPERDEAGDLTGHWLVTIGEGRRLALGLLAKRKQIKKNQPVACVVDTEFDPQEISLDENVTRSAMHPADQFEAFRDLHERKGWGAEEIAARFGVSPGLVRQRLRLANVSPRLLALYRAEDLGLDQLMAFAVSDDHARQEQVYDQLSYNRSPPYIRQLLLATKASAGERRVVFVGAEAYEAAGGTVTRDLFAEDDGGWLDDVVLLDRLAVEKLTEIAQAVQSQEGWKWSQASIDYPTGHGLARIYPRPVERSDQDKARMASLAEEYDELIAKVGELDETPPDIEARLSEIDAALSAFGDGMAYAPDEVARSGLFVILGHDGQVRIERGFMRPEDAASEPDAAADGEETTATSAPDEPDADACEDDAPLSERLVADLTAHRTASLRDALAEHPDVAYLALLHVLVLRTFYAGAADSCLDVRCVSRSLSSDAPGIEDGRAERRIEARHAGWAGQMPESPTHVWAFVQSLDSDSRWSLLAHCVSLTLDAVRGWQARGAALRHADQLAVAVELDMSRDWSASAQAYLGRVTKARILEAVTEACGAEAAERLAGLRKADMAAAAEPLLIEACWLPPLLRAPQTPPPSPASDGADTSQAA